MFLGDLMCTRTANLQGDQTSILLDHYPYPNSNPTLGTGPRRKAWGAHRLKDCTFCASPGAERGGFGDAARGSNMTRIKAKRPKIWLSNGTGCWGCTPLARGDVLLPLSSQVLVALTPPGTWCSRSRSSRSSRSGRLGCSLP